MPDALRVGPQSKRGLSRGRPATAAAAPRATVTDASLVLGYLDPEYFAGGTPCASTRRAPAPHRSHPIAGRASAAASRPRRSAFIASSTRRWPRRCASCRSAAASTRAATRCCRWAAPARFTPPRSPRSLACRASSCPPHPGVLSAAGLLAAPVEHELSWPRSARALAATRLAADVAAALAPNSTPAARRWLMAGEGTAPGAAQTVRHFADVCYIGPGATTSKFTA